MELTVEQALQKGIAAHRKGDLKDAEILYRTILKSQPTHPDANHNLGLIAVSVNKGGLALPLFKTALDANPKKQQYWFSYIDALIKGNRLDTVKTVLAEGRRLGLGEKEIDALEARLNESTPPKLSGKNKISPRNENNRKASESELQDQIVNRENDNNETPTNQQLRLILESFQNGKHEEAEKLAKSISTRFPTHPFSWKILGAIFAQTNRDFEAIDVNQRAVKLAPKDFESHSNLSTVLKRVGRLEEAEASCRQALALKPDNPGIHSNLGNTLKELGRFEEAEASYRKSIALEPSYTDTYYNLGTLFTELGRLEEADSSYKKVLALEPEKFNGVYDRLGLLSQMAGKFEEAEAYYRKYLSLEPTDTKAHYNLGITLQELGRLREAEVSYIQAIELKSDFAEAQASLGNTLKKLGRLDDAEASLRLAVTSNPNFAEANNNLGNILQELGRLDEAETSYTQAIASKPHYFKAHCNLGVTLQKMCRFDEAEARYRKTIALKPDYAEAHNNLGATLQELGKIDEAEVCYRQAIALNPDFDDARYNLGVLLFLLKRYDMAAGQFGLVDIHLSKSFWLRCSYLEDSETIFFGKLNALIDQGLVNAVIGSISCSAEIKYGVRRVNPFCNEPLKYVVKTDLNELCDFDNIFVETAKDILTNKSVLYKEQNHLTNGIQTAGNFFAIETVFITKIESIIRAEIENYRINFEDSEEGFIKNWPISYDIYGWLVCMQSGGKLTPHMHDSGWITGSVYINVPTKSKTNSGNLVLCVGDQKNLLGAQKSQESIIDVVTGSLCFFPSSLRHYTVPFEEKEDRIVLAFDVIPK